MADEKPLDHDRVAEILGSENYRVLSRDESLELRRHCGVAAGRKTMLTEEQLRAIEAVEQTATKGSWFAIAGFCVKGPLRDELADAVFGNNCRTWVPQLVAMVRELQGETRQLNAALGKADNDIIGLREQVRRLYGQKEPRDG